SRLIATDLIGRCSCKLHLEKGVMQNNMKKTDEYGLDFQILQSGAICMYHKTAILEKDLEWLRDARYRIININTRNWTSKTVHKELKEQMDFPDYYGENLNA